MKKLKHGYCHICHRAPEKVTIFIVPPRTSKRSGRVYEAGMASIEASCHGESQMLALPYEIGLMAAKGTIRLPQRFFDPNHKPYIPPCDIEDDTLRGKSEKATQAFHYKLSEEKKAELIAKREYEYYFAPKPTPKTRSTFYGQQIGRNPDGSSRTATSTNTHSIDSGRTRGDDQN